MKFDLAPKRWDCIGYALGKRYYTYEKIESIAKWIKGRISVEPQVAIVCGSGLGHIADSVEDATKIAYEEIPEFPRSTGEPAFDRVNCSCWILNAFVS